MNFRGAVFTTRTETSAGVGRGRGGDSVMAGVQQSPTASE